MFQGLCPSPGTCKNTFGGFRCVCPRGYKLDESGTFCIDKNECLDDKCGSNSECKNLQGSYKCGCPEGFVLNVIFNECVDTNECSSSAGKGPCGDAQCQNSFGSFTCLCPQGYDYDKGSRICVQSSRGRGCASGSSCAFGCSQYGFQGCNCPPGHRKVGSSSSSHCMSLNSIDNIEELDYKSSPVSTEGCFACQMSDRTTGRGRRRGRHRSSRRSRIFAYSKRRKQQQQRSKRHSSAAEKPITVRLSLPQTRPSRPVIYLQPTLVKEMMNGTFCYEVAGKDKDLFVMSPSSSSNEINGLWTLNFKAKASKTSLPAQHHIRVLGRQMKQSDPELDMRLRIVIT